MAVEVVKKSPSKEKHGTIIQSAIIRFLMLVLFLAWILIWIMTPTNTYKQIWLPQLRERTTSTYFGFQGLPLLLYTFPVLFIAVMGCFYLHLLAAKKANDSSNVERCNDNDGKKRIRKRLVLVRGPLGIVSVTELAFLIMFIALLVWSFSIYVHNDYAKITHKSAATKGLKVWENKLAETALRFGQVGNICLAFLFFPVARGSSLLPLLGLTSERCIKYHIWLGNIAMTLLTLHGASFIIYCSVTNQLSKMYKWKKIGISYVAGELSLLSGLFMWVATIPRVRRKVFELFYYTHNLYILLIVFFTFHVGFHHVCIMLPGLYLFLVDRFLRFLQSRQQVRLVSARVLPCETVELNFSKNNGLTYNPTSIMFINIPSISKLQWHPFTITSNSNLEKEKLSVVIKSEGTWSNKLYQMLSKPSSIDHLNVSVEGPYGPSTLTNYTRYDTIVMVSGGSGITPFVSISRELIYQNTTLRNRTPKIILICAFKNTSCLSMLDLILPNSGTPYDISNMQIQIEAYITREKMRTRDTPTHLQSIWFKPNADDTPISAVLGPHCWLWLASIISSSFIIFLIIIGLITNYFIFPKDHNKNNIFPFPLRSFLNLLVLCVSIVISASAAVLWNKKHNAKEAKQIQNMKESAAIVSPNLKNNNNDADRELESLPHQSIAQATNVHYGARPDLRRLLFEHKGSGVGVLVSGPMKMRQEVAAIWSSDLAENVHFESFSFSW